MSEETTKITENGENKRAATGGKMKYADNILPMVRIKKIMKMDPNISDNISVEATYLICSATEKFIRFLSKEVYTMDSKALSYENLAKYIQDDEKLDFLHQIVPHKITVREYKKIIAEDKEKVFNSGSEVSSSSSEEEDDDEEGEEEEEEDGSEDSGEEQSEKEEEEKKPKK